MGDERGPELRVGQHGPVPYAVHGTLHPQQPGRVDAPPFSLGLHPRIDLQVDVPVRVTTAWILKDMITYLDGSGAYP